MGKIKIMIPSTMNGEQGIDIVPCSLGNPECQLQIENDGDSTWVDLDQYDIESLINVLQHILNRKELSNV